MARSKRDASKGYTGNMGRMFAQFASHFREGAASFVDRVVHERIKRIKTMALEASLGLLFFVFGLFFFLAAGIFFLHQVAHLDLFVGFLLMGLIAMGFSSVFYFLFKHN